MTPHSIARWPAMMKRKTAAYLHNRLKYDPETGLFVWQASTFCENKWNARWAGRPAFTTTSSVGYKQGRLDKELVYAHRVAWAMHYGDWPAHHIDHINHVRDDNRISNLRLVTRLDNQRNQKLRVTNSSGINGVSWDPKRCRWHARIMVSGKYKFLGYFDTIEAAELARKAADQRFQFHENHGA